MIRSIVIGLCFIKYVACIRCTVGEISKIDRMEIPTDSKPLVRKGCPEFVSSCINGTLVLKEYQIVASRFDCDIHNECIKYKGNVCVPIVTKELMEGEICCCSNNENCNTLGIP
uniref:Activin_recp domain-containing protein n=1 Tax=Strongyloides venezuelensis TaxID=75913 RepID=A0A0K0G2W9_STRVS